jgi:acyl-CoA thioesterase FadM
MARLKLDFKDEQFRYRTQMRVRSTDINAGRHLGNDKMVSMLSEARARFLANAGIPDVDDAGLGIIVTDLAVSYRGEARESDILMFEVGATDFNPYGGDLIFRVTRPADGTLIALAKYGFVFFDYKAGRVSPMPDAARARLA